MDYPDINIDATVRAFLADMERGLSGQRSTLDMIPTYIEVGKKVPVKEKVIVMDAGGTNFRVATVYFDKQRKPVIKNIQPFRMPGSQRKVGKDDFFKIMAGYLRDVAGAANNIGFCFSYAVEMHSNRDGRLIRLSKEVKAPQVKGHFIGENLNRAMAKIGLGGNKHIVLLNDTVATLLAGVGYENRTYGSYIGFILGTGTNCCYVEKNSNIKKKEDLDPTKSQIINTESGGFGRCQQGKIDADFDKSTNNPSTYKFEKMISGAYLGLVCLYTIHEACKKHLFSIPVTEALWQIPVLDTKDMNEFMIYPYGDNPLANACKNGRNNGKNEDALTLYYIADRLTERTAKLTAINLSSAAIKSGQGRDPTRPICIVAEGTPFHRMKTLKSRIEFYLKQYLENKRGIHFDIISVDNATLIGAAIAGLTN